MPAVPAPPTAVVAYDDRFYRTPDLLPTTRTHAADVLIAEASRPISVEVGQLYFDPILKTYEHAQGRTDAFRMLLVTSAVGAPTGDPATGMDRMEMVWAPIRQEREREGVFLRVLRFLTDAHPAAARTESAVDPGMAPRTIPDTTVGLFLDSLDASAHTHGVPHPTALAAARRVWAAVVEALGPGLRSPGAAPAADGSFLFYWRGERHHVELEFQPDGTWTTFVMDKAAGGPEGLSLSEHDPGEQVPEDVYAILRMF